MKIIRTTHDLEKQVSAWKAETRTTGFVPTMGALHDGHLSLLDIACEKTDKTIVSIFVNPTQFAPHEDFDAYPREEDKDLDKLRRAGADLVYLPDRASIYPDGEAAELRAGSEAQGLETDFRPHFFDGVVNVVSRLFAQVRPDLAVFGEKDFQQLQVIREMVKTRAMNIEVIGAPIKRDAYGLALSSRNAYLSDGELDIARMLNQAIYNAAHQIRGGADEKQACREAEASLLTCGFDKVDYIALRWNRVLAAAWLGRTRLIDNAPVEHSDL